MHIEIFCDGAVRDEGINKPACAACAFVVYRNKKLIYSAYRLINTTSSNEAEYEAVISALYSAIAADWLHPIIYTDSSVVYNQITNNWKTSSPNLVPLVFSIKKIKQTFDFTIKQVPRKLVFLADGLCNEILDEYQGLVPSENLNI